MSFISLDFLIFFPVVTIAYFLLPKNFRWMLLLAASILFYMAFIPKYVLVLFGLIIVDYTAGRLLENSEGYFRKIILFISIAMTVGMLVTFKYFNFFSINLDALASFLHWNYSIGLLSLALPLGLSFHTFQSLSYVIEVYRGKFKAERHFGIYALYVMFYPQLVAGPIERPQHLLPQLHAPHAFEYTRVKLGLMRMAWGFFKKMVIADRLAIVVNHVFADLHSNTGLPLLIACILFTLELYFDFSAYCDIALGAAQVMGFELAENFNRPFISLSMAEFWRRWHMSLSSWFRDYFYYPVILSQKKRITSARIYAAILLTFLVTGFWHGANWTFGVFGALHGFFIVFGDLTQKMRVRAAEMSGLLKHPRLHRAFQAIIIFSLMTFACIFFRAQSLTDGWYISTHLFNGILSNIEPKFLWHSLSNIGTSPKALVLGVALSIFVFWVEHWGRATDIYRKLAEQPTYVRWSTYWIILFMILAFSESSASQFIYFQF